MHQVIIFLMSLISSWHMNQNYIGFQWCMGLAFLVIPFSFYFLKRLGFPFALLFSYIAIYSIAISGGFGRFAGFDTKTLLELADSNLATIFLFLMTFIPILEFDGDLTKIIPLFTATNALYVIVSYFLKIKFPMSTGYSGFIDYSGLNGVMIASTIAFLIPKKSDVARTGFLKLTGLILSLIAIGLSSSAIAWGVLGVVLVCRFWNIWFAPIILSGGLIVIGNKMFDSSMRFQAYRTFLGFLKNDLHLLKYGTGFGTFRIYSLAIQMKTKFMASDPNQSYYWAWLHSDYPFQVLFELGYVGLILTTLVLIHAVLNASYFKDKETLPTVVALIAACFFDYPCRYFPFAALCSLMLVKVLYLPQLGYYEKPAKIALTLFSLGFIALFFCTRAV